MNIFKAIFRNLHSRVWFIVSSVLLILILVLTILMTTVFESIITFAFGEGDRILGEGSEAIYVADFETKDEARANGERVNELMCEEGIVLLKNDNNALPLLTSADNKTKISVFGKNSADFVTGGSGSGAGVTTYVKSLYAGLEAANYELNGTLKAFYEDFSEESPSGQGRPDNPKLDAGVQVLATGETPQISYTNNNIPSSYSAYSSAAIIVISRIGGESFDLPRSMGTSVGARQASDHYLQLDQYETDLINSVCNSNTFGKVIILINSSSPMELGFLDDPNHYAYNSKIDAALWIGAPGDTGSMAIGRVLNGAVTPSGRTPDTFARDFKTDPTWQNFGDGKYSGVSGSNNIERRFVDYEEGIYVGYRYYETQAFVQGNGAYTGAINGTSTSVWNSWHDAHVVYPFGYGISYTTFTQEIVGKPTAAITANQKISFDVKVTNTGSQYAGRDAVQVYVTPPVSSIEKSHVSLVAFGKTKLIAKGNGTDTVPISIDPYDFASWDSNRTHADGNTKGAFVLEAGDYVFKLMKNANEPIDSFTLKVNSTIVYEKDPITGVTVKNRFSDADDELGQQLKRSDFSGTFPKTRTEAEKVISTSTNDGINSIETNNPFTTNTFSKQDAEGTITLADLVGKTYGDDKESQDYADWEALLDRISNDDMIKLIGEGAFKTIAISSIKKPLTIDADGPAGFVNFMGGTTIYDLAHYACEPVMAATFNEDLLFKFGEAVGNEALIGHSKGDGTPYSGWYAPGVNIHRSPFGGRAGEYFSEDPMLTGMLGAAEIKGAMSKGVYTQVKHFAANEQETNRAGVCTWMTEQALREIYLRPFEMTVKDGGTRGMMSSFNRIGTMWTGGDYRLLTEVLREEWGFRGMVICDFNTGGHMNARQMHYAGGDLNLQTVGQAWNARRSNATDMAIVRKCTKNILYTVANSNAMNFDVEGYHLAPWKIVLIIVDIALVVGIAAWGVFAVRSALKKEKERPI